MSEFTAALGLVQAERMEEIVDWKNDYAREHLDPLHPARLELPEGMTSGFYKYIVFEQIEKSTGRVYDQPCHRIMGHARSSFRTPTGWPRTTGACRSTTARRAARRRWRRQASMRVLVTGGGGFIGSHVVDRLIERGDHAADLRPQRLALPLAAGGRDLHRQHHRPRQPRPGDARLRRGHPPRRGRRRRPRPRRPGPGRGGQHARHAQRAGGRLPHRGRPRRLRLDHLGLQRLHRAGGRRGDADPGAAPPLHRDQARRRDLLRRLRRALRPRVHRAALRHPLRPARPRRRRRRQVHRPGASKARR